MDITHRIGLLTIVTSAMFLIGIGLIVFIRGPLPAIIGLVLITLSGLVFIADVKDLIVKRDREVRK